MRLLLDTNAYSELKRGHSGVASLVRRSEQVLLSSIVAGELLYGFRAGSRYEANRRELDAFLGRPQVGFLPVSFATADRFGRIAHALRQKGKPIPTNDIWIAAHALEHGAELVSFDRHFENVDGLAWTIPHESE